MTLSERIKKNTEDYKSGIINYLPFPKLGSFTDIFPGISRGEVTCFTGTPSSGKTSLVKWLAVFNGIKWAIKNNKRFHIHYFGLEESQTFFWYSALSWVLWEKFQLRYNVKDFECVGTCVDEKHFGMLEAAEKLVDKMRPYVSYYDSIYNPYGQYKTIREYAWNNGTFYQGETKITEPSFKENAWDNYIPNNPEEFILVVTDHLLVLHPEKDKTEHQTIADCVEYGRAYMAKKFNYSVVYIQHQDNTTEGNENRRNQEVLCTMAGLGKNKEVNKHYLNLIGITNLNRTNETGNNTGIQNWNGIAIPKMGNHSRTINVLKNRYGTLGNDTCFFDGKCCNFETLDMKNLNQYYDRVKSYSQPVKNESKLFQ